jgi:RluA family pseudouridine synthase
MPERGFSPGDGSPSGSFGHGSSGQGSGSGPVRRPTARPAKAPKSPHRGKHLRPEVVFEDEHILVLLKPPGLLSAAATPGDDRTPSVFGFAKEHVKLNGRPGRGRNRTWIIHRLDREASGLLVFAKTDQAFEHLKDELRSRRMNRMYEAVVVGTFEDPRPVADQSRSPLAGSIRSFLREGRDERMESISVEQVRPGQAEDMKEAVTHYRVEASGRGLTLLRIRLESGRKHQIRVQLASIGHAVAGDRVYGGDDHPDPCGRLALHAVELSFAHPVTGEMMRFRRDAPASFRAAVGLRKDGAAAPSHQMLTPEQADSPMGDTQHGVSSAETNDPGNTSWDHVAGWYDQLIDKRRSDHHDEVILPGTLRLLNPKAGERVLDIACGQGILARGLVERGTHVVGIDLSPRLLESASKSLAGTPTSARFIEMDAREMGLHIERLGGEHTFDAAAMVMAAMNIDPIAPTFEAAHRLLKPDGRLVIVMLHPAFRAPEQSEWHWEEDDAGNERCVRLVSGYLSPNRSSIVMNPGQAARGRKAVTTWTFHRPLQAYISALAGAGFVVDALEEWASRRRSDPGRRSAEENRSRREIPLFMALRARSVQLPVQG